MSARVHDGDDVLVTSVPHPFKVAHEVVRMEEGLTIAEMVERAQPDPFLREHAVACINGDIIPVRHWKRVRPKKGTHVEIRAVPHGGGGSKNILRIVLIIAVIAASIFLGPALGGALFGAEFVIGGVTAAQLGTAIIGMVGMVLVNVLVPVKPPKIGGPSGVSSDSKDSPTYSIEGARNQARPFSPVPFILGRHRMVPPLGAQSYTEVVGDKQFLRMIFVWGIGPLEIDESSLKIGETPLSNFTGVEIEHRAGYASDGPLTLYPDTVAEEAFSILLTSAGGFTQRTSQDNADELSVDFSFIQGLVRYDDRGKRNNHSVAIQIQYRKVGDVTWLTPTFTAKTVPDNWVSGDTITFTHKKASPVRHGFTWAVAERAQYEIQVRRITNDTDDSQILDDVAWVVLRTITDEDPIQTLIPVAKTALRIQATDQLNRVIDEFNGIVTTIGMSWNGSTWDNDTPITNPAALYRHVLQGNGVAVPLADERIDLTTIQTWHEFCDSLAYEFNQVRDFQTSVLEVLSDVASGGRASPTLLDGKWSVVIDQVQEIPVSHITPRNSFDFRMEKAFPDIPDAWRIPFVNEAEGYRQDERRVYRDGFSKENATKFESIEFPGITKADLIFHFGRFRIAQGLYQPERWTFQQDLEYITCRRGARVRITHDVILIGLCSGRVKTVTVDGSNDVTAITVDEYCPMEAGKTYNIAIRTVLGGNITAQVVTNAGNQKSLTFVTPIVNTAGQPTVARGNVFGFGEAGLETDDATVLGIVPSANLKSARIVTVPYRPVIYDADVELAPPHVTNITPIPVLPAPTVVNVVSDESALIRGPGNSLLTRIIVELQPLTDPRLDNARIEIQRRPSDTGEPFSAAEEVLQDTYLISIGDVNEGEIWDLRLRFTVSGRQPGPWTEVNDHVVVGKSNPPANVTGTLVTLTQTGFRVSWNENVDPDLRNYEVRKGTVWESAEHLAFVDATEWVGLVEGTGTLTFLVKARDTSDNESLVADSDSITIEVAVVNSVTAQVIDNNVLLRWTYTATSWPVSHFTVRRGDPGNPGFSFATEIGVADVTFHNVQELTSGLKTYWVAPIDIAGNQGTPFNLAVEVDAPPDFVLRRSFLSDFLGVARNDVLRLPDPADKDASARYGAARDRICLLFDGVDDLVDLPSTAINGLTDFTFEVDVRPIDDTHEHCVVSAANAAEDDEFNVIILDATSVSVSVKGTANTFPSLPNLFDDNWHKLSVTRVSATGAIELYVDAASEGTAVLPTGALSVDASGFVLGQEQDAVAGGYQIDQAYEGYMDEVRLWNDIRSSTEIGDFMDLLLTGDETGLVANWHFGAGEGVVVEDPLDNDGTIVGASWNVPVIAALMPFPVTETVADRETVHGFVSPQDQIDGGYPYVAQPVPFNPNDSTFQTVHDMGSVVEGTRIVVSPTVEEIVAGYTEVTQIETRETLLDAWTVHTVGNEAFANNFRYVRVTRTIESTDGHGFTKQQYLDVVGRVKEKTDAGIVNVTANPTTVNFNEDFLDVSSITVTPQGTTALFAVVDFNDVANPTSFDIYLFNGTDASPATGNVRWNARGF